MKWFPCVEPLCRRSGDGYRGSVKNVVAQLRPSTQARARADKRVAVAQPAPEPRLDRLVKQPRLRQPPKEVAAEEPLRQRCLARPDRELDAMGRGELRRDLKAGVTAADDENRSLRD